MSGAVDFWALARRRRRQRKIARRMPDFASVSTSPGVAVARNSDTSRLDAGRRSGSSTRSITSRKAMSSGGKRMTMSATTRPPVGSGPGPRMTDASLSGDPHTLDRVSSPGYARPQTGRGAPARRPGPGALPGVPPFDPAETAPAPTRRTRRMARELAVIHPDAQGELDFTNAFEL